MKTKKYFYVLLLIAGGVWMASCSKDDDNTPLKSDAKQITSFIFKAPDNEALGDDVIAEINEGNKTITATVLFGTDVTALVPDITISEKATISPEGVQDFSGEVIYTITAEDGTKATYKVTAKMDEPSAEKQIISFIFRKNDNETVLDEDLIAEIDHDNHTIIANVRYGTNLIASMVPEIEISEGASVNTPTDADFSKPVTFIVTAQDQTQATYTFSFNFIATTQREVLIAIYLNNPENTLNWDITSEDISDWTGVNEVDDQGNITSLTISDKNLETIPPEIGQLTNLKSLSLSNNQLTFAGMPTEIGKLESLESLDLSANQLENIPAEILQLKSLNYLILSNNQLKDLPKENGQPTQSLKRLNLTANQLNSIPEVIGDIKSLEFLILSNNQLTSISESIGQLTNLKELRCFSNQISSISPAIGQLTSLERLSFRRNQLTSVPVELGLLSNLIELSLDENLLASIPQEVCDLEDNGTYLFKDSDVVCGDITDD
ncbi:leucine-rich repeat domain-containing protein [Abyssalbus ytuae]|uniref:Leucine-rich repeat domain-containing protein n=1 Tax=Abyssalbus ytuae TaxID=2926907 RepID=A0A9E7D404_9FLAO|nr:leucine-rich repeat domain-containing protein [Abyssalbus ytuae]UOB18384.1 leucine-rich repeat domain-containing protein [Abyssalbus ytuae]